MVAGGVAARHWRISGSSVRGFKQKIYPKYETRALGIREVQFFWMMFWMLCWTFNIQSERHHRVWRSSIACLDHRFWTSTGKKACLDIEGSFLEALHFPVALTLTFLITLVWGISL